MDVVSSVRTCVDTWKSGGEAKWCVSSPLIKTTIHFATVAICLLVLTAIPRIQDASMS